MHFNKFTVLLFAMMPNRQRHHLVFIFKELINRFFGDAHVTGQIIHCDASNAQTANQLVGLLYYVVSYFQNNLLNFGNFHITQSFRCQSNG
jgi:hypothetical protein